LAFPSPTTFILRGHQGPRAVLNALERLATGYCSESVRVRQDLAIAEYQLRDYRERLGKPFAHDAHRSHLTSLRDQLEGGLSSMAHDASNDSGPTVSELAERVNALKVDNSIEATPQRDRQKRATAEEPITARIRKRQEGNSVSDHPVEQDVSTEPPALQPPTGR
jgi:hypothetical protein